MSAAARPLLLLHGAGGGAWQWRDWLPVLTDAGFALRALDYRPAAAGLAATSLIDYRRQAEAAFDALAAGGRPVAVIGASLGGLLGALLAEERPVAALVLVNPVPPAQVADWRYRTRRFPAVIDWSRGITLEDTRASMPEADEATVGYTHAHWRDESGAVMQAACAGVTVQPPRCPCLVLCGEADTSMPPSVCRATAQTYRAEVRSFPGASHVGALLGPHAPALAQAAVGWLRSTAAADR